MCDYKSGLAPVWNPIDPIWTHLTQFGPVWPGLAQFDSVLPPFCPVWPHLALTDLVWSCFAPKNDEPIVKDNQKLKNWDNTTSNNDLKNED